MAGSGEDDRLPNLDDDEGGNESTVAMDAPSFVTAGQLPISNPPPAAAPAPAPAPAPASARSPAAPPARAPGTPASPASPARPAFAGAPPRPPGAAGKPVGKATVIGLAPPGPRPGGTGATPSAPRVAAPAPAPAPPRPASRPDSDPPGEGATMASEPGAMAGFGKNYPLDPPVPGRAASPLASTGYAPPNGESKEENDAATVTVPKDVLDRVRSNPKALLEEEKRAVPRIVHDEDADGGDETKAVPREELLRPQVARVAVSAGVAGEDATLAVAPASNDAARIGASIGDALAHAPPQDPNNGAYPSIQGFPQQGFGGGAMPPYGGPGGQPGGMAPMPGPHAQPWSSGHMPAAPHAGSAPGYGGGPMMQAGAAPRGNVPTNWSPLQAPPAKSKISGQMILLFVVGFVCLAIFVTGIVLFATTKF